MTTKTKTAIAGSVLAVGVATASLLGINTTDEITQTVTTPIVSEVIKEQTAEVIEVEAPTVEETEATEIELYGNSEQLEETDETDPLAPYRTAVEKDGVLIYYYSGVPPDLMPLFIQDQTMTLDLYSDSVVQIDDSDLSIVDNYIFVQTANGMLYLSQLSHGIVADERITQSDYKGYAIYLNQTIECTEWLPFKNFAGTLYGNGNAIYIASLQTDTDISLTIDNSFAETLTGELAQITIICNATDKAFIQTAAGGKLTGVIFEGDVSYILESAENIVIDSCQFNGVCNAVIKNADTVTLKNTLVACDMKTATLETAAGECVIENNIFDSTIQGEAESRCGAMVGTLKNEIVIKNNLSLCKIDVPIGYGGHAIGYVDYEYTESDNITGNYFESTLTVEGTASDLFIGNIDSFKITAALEALSEPIKPIPDRPMYDEETGLWVNSDGETWNTVLGATYYTSNDVATTVYNLALFPDWFGDLNGMTDEYKAELAIYESELAEYNIKVERLTALENAAKSDYSGFYENIDISAYNDYADLNGFTPIYEYDGEYYFEQPEIPDELTITNVTYADGDMILFLNQNVSNVTAIITTLGDTEKINTMSITEITGSTCFVEVPHDETSARINVMLWDSVGSMKPLCKPYQLEVNADGNTENS